MPDYALLARQKGFAADKDRAAYFWSIRTIPPQNPDGAPMTLDEKIRAGITIVEEYDVFGNEHKMSEWPAPPYLLCAISYRAVEGRLRHLCIEIEPGMEPVFEHRVREGINVFVPGEVRYIDCMIFGRRYADGRETVMRVYPDGEAFAWGDPAGETDALVTARAHTRPQDFAPAPFELASNN
jgi:hypothetical protein